MLTGDTVVQENPHASGGSALGYLGGGPGNTAEFTVETAASWASASTREPVPVPAELE